jgi:ABC-type dipeptide/oligopeptide/nickel transport system ATPase subunit
MKVARQHRLLTGKNIDQRVRENWLHIQEMFSTAFHAELSGGQQQR